MSNSRSNEVFEVCCFILSEHRKIEDVDFLISLKQELKHVNFKDNEVEVLKQRELEGEKFEDIANSIGLSEKRCRNLYTFAKKKLHLAILNTLEK